MANKKLAFSYPQCACGCDLSHKKADIVGMKGNIPMGYCPQCGRPQRLGSSAVTEPQPPPEPEATEPEPTVPAPEPEPET